MTNLSRSLFSRLYLTIVLTVILSVTLTAIVTENYTEQEHVGSFIKDVSLIFENIELNENYNDLSSQKSIELPFPLHRYFSAKIINTDFNANVCTSCQFIKSINSVNYYELEEGERLAEFSLKQTGRKLVIYEKLDSERSNEELEEILLEDDSGEIVFFALTAITLLLLGITVYWPIKNLQTQIRQLIQAHHQFGLGKMNVKANEKIQKPLDELACSFNVMAQAIADNVKERDTFSQAIPHEVRTPLSRIQLASGLIRKKSTDLDILALVDDVDKYVIDINELIRQIVEFSRLNENEEKEIEQYQTIEVKAFVESRVRLLANNQDKELILVIDETLELTTNPFYLRLLIDNFIKNALNHADKKIRLSAIIKNNQLSIIVEDDGVGVPIDDRATIFIPFARLDKSRSRKTGGLGLGLPIAKAAAKKMDGDIVVAESPSGGAMFSFTRHITN